MAARRQALRNDPQLQRYIIPNVLLTGRQLGVGSYGSVEELEINSLICAGKRIHEMLIEPGNAGLQNIVRKYVEECRLLSDLRHPHIVQFLGVCFLPDSSLPVLVMERLLMSLDDLLENTPDIPLTLKRSMLADVSKGLVYLHNHSSPIIHRDLSAKNVLLNSAMAAKISDLGNSRIIDLQPGQLARTLSHLPGTLAYMAPEAFDVISRYGPRLDIFSFGHLALFTITQVFPGDLLPHNYPDPENRRRLIGRSELERRGDYIDQLHQQLGERHPMVQLVEQCLDNDPDYRPSSEDVLQRLEGMRSQIRDPYQGLTRVEMMKLLEQKDVEIQSQLQRGQGSQAMDALRSQLQQMQLEISGSERTLRAELEVKGDQLSRLQGETDSMRRDLRALQSEISTQDRQLQEKDRQLQEKDRQLQEKDRQLQEKDTTIRALQSDISTKDMLLASVRADLEARETRMREEIQLKDAENERLSGQLRTLQLQLQTHQQLKGQTPPQMITQPQPPAIPTVEPVLQPGASLQWKKCADLPVGMNHAQAVVLKNKIYVGGGITKSRATDATIYIYAPTADTWSALPSPARQSALTTYHSQLVLVGGVVVSSGEATNQLWVLQEDEQTWRQPLPAMPTARYGVSAISHLNHIIAPGGRDSSFRDMNVVEVYDGHQWMKTDPLPRYCSFMRATIHNETCYLMGGDFQYNSVFCASLHSLIAKITQQSPTSHISGSVWETLPDVPYVYSATTILGGALVAVGGWDSSLIPSSSLLMYSRLTHSWLHVSDMPVTVRAICTTTLPTGEMMVIGGRTKGTSFFHNVYKASL